MVSTIETANAEIAVNSAKAPEGSVWRHKKSGGVYVVKLHVIVEATLAPAVSITTGKRPNLRFGVGPHPNSLMDGLSASNSVCSALNYWSG